jgi:D-glycero-D-manno-heptose 1,7-bisphosphate phosphatase
MNKAFFLDRDGVINVEKNFLYKPSDLEFIPGVIEALRTIKAAGYLAIVTTNQSGVARGYFTEEDILTLHRYMNAELDREGVKIDAFYYCPHLPDGTVEKYRVDCDCRKPQIGMYLKAQADHHIDFGESFAVGDRLSDVEEISALIRGSALVKSGHGNKAIEDSRTIEKLREGRIYIEENLLSAVIALLSEKNKYFEEDALYDQNEKRYA